jgi:hypothetical protein
MRAEASGLFILMGATRTLALDIHRKSLSSGLLDLDVSEASNEMRMAGAPRPDVQDRSWPAGKRVRA